MADLSVLYATALFDLWVESGEPDEHLEQALILRDTLDGDECKAVVLHPHISTAEKIGFFQGAFAGKIHDDLLGFLSLAVKKNRESFLVPALTELIEMIHHRKNRMTANVMSAVELREDQVTALRELLSKRLNKQIDLELRVDPSVIGGININLDGYFIDRTIKKQLHDMKVSMKKEQVT